MKTRLRGAYDRRERERRKAISDVYWKAVKTKDTRLFWKAIRIAGIPEDGEKAMELYGKFREAIGEIPPRNPSGP